MNEPQEHTPAGGPVYRHKQIDRPAEIVVHRSAFADRIEAHMEQHIGPAPNVLHEIISDRLHLDLHVCPPTASRNFYVLFTTGMSTRPMNTPPGADGFKYAELLLALPAHWPALDDIYKDFNQAGHPWKKEEHFWPIRLLKSVARMPDQFNTWLCYGHTVAAGEEGRPFAPNTKLSTAFISLPLGILDPKSAVLKVDDSITIMFYSVVPIYSEERDFKLQHGADALFDFFEKEKLGTALNPIRKNLCAKKKRWFGF